MPTSKDFAATFKVGEIIQSGGPRSTLEIVEIAPEKIVIVPTKARLRGRHHLSYEKLNAVLDGFDEVVVGKLNKTVNAVLRSRIGKTDFTNENYLYGFAREYRIRNNIASDDSIVFPEEVSPTVLLTEGSPVTITVNAYERDSRAKRICIQKWGTLCHVCGFNFKDKYGKLGDGFIHVHHLKPISTVKKQYVLDASKDLRPVCPNCHAMLHRRKDVLSIEELKKIIKESS